ncbi:MAG: hypothetical protein GY723_18380 [bacterium]|nr:hypothetical protein [bacterium]MCP5071605.1 hypothetical protein [bacterium]
MRFVAITWGALLALMACSEAQPPARPPAPVTPAAALILEPPHLEIGETATLEVAIAVPPGTRVGPVPAPDETPGLWILDVDGPSESNSPERDVHRTRFRIRARETGSFEWPASEVRIILPDDREQVLEVPARAFQVRSVAQDVPGQLTFFSYRSPVFQGERARPADVVLPALVGAALALAGVGLLAWVRRSRAARQLSEAEPNLGNAPWRTAQAALAAAGEIAESDLPRAADMASAALRVFVDRRFRAQTTRATSEELRSGEAPFLLTTRWEPLLDLLEQLDALRFPPQTDDPRTAVQTFRGTIETAQAFVTDATPRGNTR